MFRHGVFKGHPIRAAGGAKFANNFPGPSIGKILRLALEGFNRAGGEELNSAVFVSYDLPLKVSEMYGTGVVTMCTCIFPKPWKLLCMSKDLHCSKHEHGNW